MHLPLIILGRKAKAGKHAGDLPAKGVALHRVVALHQPLIFTREPQRSLRVACAGGQLALQGAHALLHGDDLVKHVQQRAVHRLVGVDIVKLAQVADLQPLAAVYRAAVRLQLAGDEAHKRGFAAAVHAHQAHLLALL